MPAILFDKFEPILVFLALNVDVRWNFFECFLIEGRFFSYCTRKFEVLEGVDKVRESVLIASWYIITVRGITIVDSYSNLLVCRQIGFLVD
ncbi:hypothetical protein C463_12372 [Halorubrum californiense DSM 19288]|uniref:Uncharacterized protein n=1 Tax=Halorubrum californiense DSM 19288 TaxID=1227465 RepID=M0E130_9EURY|nr:hypothetical protein C463_12372 [Halorubrum californiense DSM 19288]